MCIAYAVLEQEWYYVLFIKYQIRSGKDDELLRLERALCLYDVLESHSVLGEREERGRK